jgi:hypothetical protein
MSWSDRFVIYLVFSLTGTCAVLVVKPVLKFCCVEGVWGLKEGDGFIKGPWQYRVLYFCIMYPTYTIFLLAIAACFQRYMWFSKLASKMWGRFLPRRAAKFVRRMLVPEVPMRSSVGWTSGTRSHHPAARATAGAEAATAAASAAAAAGVKAIPGTIEEPAKSSAAVSEEPPAAAAKKSREPEDPWLV